MAFALMVRWLGISSMTRHHTLKKPEHTRSWWQAHLSLQSKDSFLSHLFGSTYYIKVQYAIVWFSRFGHLFLFSSGIQYTNLWPWKFGKFIHSINVQMLVKRHAVAKLSLVLTASLDIVVLILELELPQSEATVLFGKLTSRATYKKSSCYTSQGPTANAF